MGKRVFARSMEELTRNKVKFALSLKVSPKVIAKKARVSEKTVRNIKKRKRVERRKGSGRKAILSQSDKMKILHRLRHNPFASLANIRAELDLPFSVKTINNYLKSSGFRWRKPDHKAPITTDDKNAKASGTGTG